MRHAVSNPHAWIGTSGWFYWHWKGLFYPEDVPTHRWFGHYARNFRTVELNAPFYSWPKPATIKTWVRQAPHPPKQFRYTIKVNRIITHEKRFQGVKKLVREFYGIADVLGPKMGCFLFQLPPSFHYSPAKLKRVLDHLDPAHRNVVEFRHKSWWNGKVYRAFERGGAIFCSVSGPRLPDDLIQTANDIYVRFHGTKRWYRHDYSKEELTDWSTRIKASGAQQAWLYFNNDREGYAIKNARILMRLMKSI